MTERHLVPLPEPPDEPRGLTPPHNPDYERRVLGAALLHSGAAEELRANRVVGSCFYTPAHEHIWNAVLTCEIQGKPTDPSTVHTELKRRKTLTRAITASMDGNPLAYLWALVETAPPTLDEALYYATTLRSLAARRRHLALATRLQQIALSDDDTADTRALEQLREHLDDETTRARIGTTAPGVDVDTFLSAGDDDYAWLIPGFLERGDRCILTAGEGVGKSTMLRQWGVQFAAGLQPFTLDPIPPVKVLLLDLENSERQTRRALRPLRAKAGPRFDPANLVIHCKPDGLDLTQTDDTAWLDQLLTHHRPDVLITGPIYKLAGGNPNDEVDAKPAALTLDRLRTTHDLALLLEAHSAKPNGGKRPREPFGWSGWMRWPEFGLHLSEDGDLTHWRGARDKDRAIPGHFQRGGEWPWNPVMNINEQRWLDIKKCITSSPEKLSERQISERTNIPRTTVQRILRERSTELAALRYWADIDDQDGTGP